MARRKHRGTTCKGKRKGTPARRNKSLKDPVVGYFAYSDLDALCEHDACIITGSKAALGGLLDRLGPEFAHYTIRSTTAAELLAGITQGAPYALDEEAYERLRAPAHKIGLPLPPEDFSDPGPIGLHFVRLQIPIPFEWT